MKKKLWFLVLLQCLVLLFIAGQHYTVLMFGKEIMLKTVPVDPRDPFRGDFTRMRYEISDIKLPASSEECKGRCKVYVLLEEKEGFYVFKAASFKNDFKPGTNEAVVIGNVLYRNNSTAHVTYGIEEAFVEEGKGKALENRNAKVTASVKVLNGRAVLDGVYLNGQEYK